jgi:hypothetical protein
MDQPHRKALTALGKEVPKPVLYDTLLGQALKGDTDCGGLLSYGYISGEHITGLPKAAPCLSAPLKHDSPGEFYEGTPVHIIVCIAHRAQCAL